MAGVRAVEKSVTPARPGSAPAPVPAGDPTPKLPGDKVTLTRQPVPFEDAATSLRKGMLEVIGGSALFAAGGVGLALTLSAPVWVPIAFGAAAVGGAALAIKGVDDYGKGIAQLLVDVLLLPFHIARAFMQ